MPTLLLIRHGQASYAAEDYDVLSEPGREQTRALHASLAERGVRPARMVSGSLRRQVDSADPWMGDGAELVTDARWDEYDAADVLGAHSPAAASLERPVGEGGRPLSSREFQDILDRALLSWIAAGEASTAREPWTRFRARAVAAMEEAMDALSSGQTGLVFTSGGVLSALAAAVLELPDTATVAFNRVSINGAVSKLVGGRSGISMVSFNEHAHLEPGRLVTYR